jgi:hypothetical protein
MSNPENHTREGVFATRQCARQKAELPFHLGGLDALGRFFEELIITRDFSECGGSFATSQSIAVGATLKLAGPTGFLSLIRIVWRRQTGTNCQSYGFSFVQPLEEYVDAVS